jgi:hypothetical protein
MTIKKATILGMPFFMSHRNSGIKSSDIKIDSKNGTIREAEYFSPAMIKQWKLMQQLYDRLMFLS